MIEHSKLWLSSLSIANFRNYSELKINTDSSPVIITGENGAGKTNILEAISLLIPGKGIRAEKISDLQRNGTDAAKNPWVLIANSNINNEENIIATGLEFTLANSAKRIIKVNSNKIKKQSELNEYISILHAIPKMDHIFNSGSKLRREFIDNLTGVFDLSHFDNLKIYEKFLRERRKLLQNYQKNSAWLDSVEKTIAESAVIIATARKHSAELITKFLKKYDSAFPKADIRVSGYIEDLLDVMPALQAEEEYLAKLNQTREFDFISGITKYGPHRSDLQVFYPNKMLLASNCSTGEQKSLLISILLAAALARQEWYGFAPIMLLDDFFAHLDENIRHNLLKEIVNLRLQAWITSTDKEFFLKFSKNMQFFTVKNSIIC